MAGYSCEALRTNCSSEKYVIRQVIGSWSDSKAFEWNLNTAGQRQGGLGDFMPREHAAFRAEKRSAQASAHLLSQAQGRLFCLLTVFDCFVCHWESFGWDWGGVYMRKFAPARVSFRDDFLILYPVYMMTRSFHISLFEGTIHVNKIYVWFKIANITHAIPVPVHRQTDFPPKRVVVSRLHDIVARFRTGVKFSPRYNNRGKLTPGWLAPAWRFAVVSCYHVNKCRAMRGNRSELAPGRKSPRCHVNTPWMKCTRCERLLLEKSFYLCVVFVFRHLKITLESEQRMLKQIRIILRWNKKFWAFPKWRVFFWLCIRFICELISPSFFCILFT